VLAAAAEAGRPAPTISSRFRVALGQRKEPFYMLSGSSEELVTGLREFAAAGVQHVALDFGETDTDKLLPMLERFDAEVRAAL
jgi:hypothetical protein